MAEIVRLENLKKHFPGVRALDGVSMSVRAGEVHALIGENGAGKSTLVKLLTGVHTPDGGRILVDGSPVELKSPQDAHALGITAIHQEASVFPNLSVTENIFMGHLDSSGYGLLDWKTMRRRTEKLLGRFGVALSPDARVKDLSIAQRQQIEIVKALSLNARVIIMDEPTSTLSLREIRQLYDLVRRLKAEGTAIVFISHKFDEIFEITDVYTVLRDGKFAGSGAVKDATGETLVRMMAGSSVGGLFPDRTPNPGEVALQVEKISLAGAFEDVSFGVRRGEIVGFFGLIGSGRSEVMQSIFGVRTPDTGRVRINGEDLRLGSPRDAMNRGLVYVPEDRQLQGIILDMKIYENVTLPFLKRVTKLGFTRRRKEYEITEVFAKRLSLRASSYAQAVESLSGGNQQKVVLSKWLATDPSVLILDEPTRGIDVGTKAAVHQFIGELADRGFAIIVVSSELHEVIGMSDRVLVMREGRVAGEFRGTETSSDAVLSTAIGAASEHANAEVHDVV